MACWFCSSVAAWLCDCVAMGIDLLGGMRLTSYLAGLLTGDILVIASVSGWLLNDW